MKFDAVYDKKLLFQGLLGLLFLCAAMKVTGGAGFLLIFPLVVLGFSKNKAGLLFWCILATTVLTMTNNALVEKGSIFSIVNRLLYMLVGGVMFFQLVGVKVSKILTPLLALFPFLAYMAIVSSVGWAPIISYLKLFLFVVVFLAFYGACSTLQRSVVGAQQLRSIFLCFACFIILGSVALIPFPGISLMRAEDFFQQYGYYPDGALFCGITWHSQALGPLVAICSVILLADLLFSIRRWDPLYGLLLVLSPVLIYKTGARTAMGTYLAGICFVSFVFMCAQGVGARWKNKALSLLFLIGLAGGCAFMATPSLRQGVVNFVFKTRVGDVAKEDMTFERAVSSRQGLVDISMKNFKESPWIGNGFQVSEMYKGVKIRSWKQLLSAPIEKGVWVAAVLEEGGIFGLILISFFWIFAFATLLSRHAFIGASGLFVLFVSNFGEFTVFSMSGNGGILWAMIFMGVALDAARLRAASAAMSPVYGAGTPWRPDAMPPGAYRSTDNLAVDDREPWLTR